MTTGSHPGYLLDNRARESEDRFAALAELFDPVTFGHLDVLGIGARWRCWEVGAGGPSVVRWMADRVGPEGQVLATDIDLTWLAEAAAPPIEIRSHDVVRDDPPVGEFDLVHARLVLCHLPGRDEALRRMVRAVRPGGWLIVEDFDVSLQPRAVLDAMADFHHRANRVRDAFEALLGQRGVDLQYGRTLLRRLRDAGLTDVAADAYLPIAKPAASALEQANVRQIQALIDQRLATADEISDHLDALHRGVLDITTPPLVSAWGRRP